MAWLAHAKAGAGDHAAALSLTRDLVALAGTRVVSPYHLAIAQLGSGDPDAALTSLERAPDECDPGLVYVAAEPRFRPLHSEPRFKSLLSGLNLEART